MFETWTSLSWQVSAGLPSQVQTSKEVRWSAFGFVLIDLLNQRWVLFKILSHKVYARRFCISDCSWNNLGSRSMMITHSFATNLFHFARHTFPRTSYQQRVQYSLPEIWNTFSSKCEVEDDQVGETSQGATLKIQFTVTASATTTALVSSDNTFAACAQATGARIKAQMVTKRYGKGWLILPKIWC